MEPERQLQFSCYYKKHNFILSLVMLSDTSFANELRQLAATCIAQDPVTYNEAFLGKTNSEYCQWLSQPDHWGGLL